jgi:hypothetical protein
VKSLQRWFEKRRAARPARRPDSRKSRPTLESLESRVVLYSATGNAWLNPTCVTISFMPDGTNLGGPTSNLYSSFNGNSNLNGKWQTQILKAAQQWAQQTNVNLVVVSDNGTAFGGGNDEEGDPGIGDIRIGGYNFGTSTLAWSYQPPSVNNFSVAGDIVFNTGQSWNVGKTYDLFTVAMHEFGHTFGLGQSNVSGSLMTSTYAGVKTGLASDDITGVQSIYSAGGARSPDAYGALNNSFSTAASVTSLVDPVALTGLATNLDIATAGQSEYFSVVAPAGTNGTMQVAVQSQGLSLLAPQVTVYSSAQLASAALRVSAAGLTASVSANVTGSNAVLGSASGTGQYGTTLTLSIPNVVAGQTYYIQVQGADTTAMGTGDYALGLSFGGAAPPVEASPIIAYANGNPLTTGGGQAQESGVGYNLVGAPPSITGISPDTGSSSSDSITSANRITISGIAPDSETIALYRNGNLMGTTVSDSNGNWTFDNTGTVFADGTYTLTATATDPSGNVSALSLPFSMTIDSTPPAAPTFGGLAPGFALASNFAVGLASSPILYGSSAPYSHVALYNGTTLVSTATADPSGHWNFQFATGTVAPGFYMLNITATDLAGNVSGASAPYFVWLVPASGWATASAAVNSDSIASSSVLGTTPSGYIDTTVTPTINGTATANSEVVVFEDGIAVGVAWVDGSGSWSYTCSTLTTGVHKLSFEDVNLASGSFSAMTGPLTIQV